MGKKLGFLLLLLPLPLTAEPLLKNTGFDKELAPWECEEGKIVPDPDNKDNSLLEIELDGGVFGLSQAFKWPEGKKELTLSFRIKASAASKDEPIQWRLRIYDKDEASALAAGAKIEKSGEWITVKQVIERPESAPVSMMLESNRGEGKLWIDDLKLG
ncbi:hypothetical protein OJ996_02015 [Luteolibacter sp. GHJ8]|uniref:CBM-cenC domain-containing protein n=1 Tax=Luteolibacter rhizosphaerae TaxID=2989719 RepID=A0ABT3FXP0_9BACT|nr:hypothetical protein [Luteolibacter rhizosphaerae]MCW1912330.1 hypothetical protein [Luteolibacter rhizosphaerae]